MGKKPIVTAAEAASWVKDNDVVVSGGFVGSCLPEALTKALEKRFLETGSPKNLTLFFSAGQGNRDGSAADRFAHEGMTGRVIGGHWNLVPNLGRLAMENKIEAYNFPQGVLTHLLRDIAAHRVGTITHVGLNTFIDPRLEGGKLNGITQEDLVEVVSISGQERLLYKALSFDIGFIRGSYADENGNVTLEREVCPLDATSIAQAVKNSGGKVIVQVERVVASGTLDPRLVKIPGIYVDAIVVVEDRADHAQCAGIEYDGSMTGDFHVPPSRVNVSISSPLDAKKIIARRAVLELTANSVVNLGIGVPEYISTVASEEGIADYMTLTVESGPVGGVPQGGPKFGASVNPEALLDQAYQFDFYDGGGLDLAFLGLAQADAEGSINVSKFGPRIAGCGGFVNITQNAKRVFFCGTFTAGGLRTDTSCGKLVIAQEGREHKFVPQVEQVTFSGKYAVKTLQPVLYITERAVFQLREDGMYLIEVAPGIDIKTQVLDQMGFIPKMDGVPKLMDARIFREEPMGMKGSER